MIDGRSYCSGPLAFLWMTGRWPTNEIDHKNRNRSDDRWENLRPATCSQNHGNTIHNRNNNLGIKGVCYEAKRGKFKAYIQIDGRSVNLGRFDTAQQAQATYEVAAIKYFGEFARSV